MRALPEGRARVGNIRLRAVVVAVCITLPEAACIPIPARHQEQVTPTIFGTLALDDGTPAAHYFIAATDDEKDLTCSRPGGRGITDSLGRFHLAEIKEEKKIFWITMWENFGMRAYWLCARPAAGGVPGGGLVDAPSWTFIFGHFSGDSLDCVQWSWRDTTRLNCNVLPLYKQLPRPDLRMLRGGSWRDGEVTGGYRVLFVEAHRWPYEARAVVQWLGGSPGSPKTVRAEMALPTHDLVEFWGASLDEVGGS